MSEASLESRRIRRVLVALDASGESLAAAGAAAKLAALLEAELTGLFVEDKDLLQLSESPMAQQANLLTAAVESLEIEEVEQQFRALAVRARRALSLLAEAAGVPWSFRVARGSVTREIQAAATESDLVSLGRIGWSLRQRRVLGRTARSLLAESRRYTLLTEREVEIRQPVLVVFDGRRAGVEALELGLRLSDNGSAPLVVALVGENLPRLRQAAFEIIDQVQGTAKIVEIGALRGSKLARFARGSRPGLVILPVGSSELDEDQVQELLDEVRCPILAVS